MKKGSKMSEVSKEKMRIAFRGRIQRGWISPMKGKTHSEKARSKIKFARSKQIITEEHKIKISKKLKGRPGPKRTDETKNKLSILAQLGIIGMKGKMHTKETKKKMSILKQKERHPYWKGGLTRLGKQEKRANRSRPILCDICNSGGKICFDHCHKTGKFRGWLCIPCNTALGMAKDNPILLEKLIYYLKSHSNG